MTNHQELRERLAQAGIFQKQQRYYVWELITVGLGLAVSYALFTRPLGMFALLLNACFLAFLTVKLGFLMHDASHHCLFESGWKNDLVGLIATDLLNGFCYGWYAPLHVRHHSHTNRLDDDPDMVMVHRFFALTPERAARAWVPKRWLIRYQAPLLPFLLPMGAFVLKYFGISFLIRRQSKWRWLEVGLLTIHYTLYFWFLFHFLDSAQAIVIILVHHFVAGIHLAGIQVPNHWGREIPQDDPKDWLDRQLAVCRNIRTHPAMEFLFGGLNHQIEHHIFPALPRNQILRAVPLVRQFCAEKGVAYHELDLGPACQEVYSAFQHASRGAYGPERRKLLGHALGHGN